MSTPDIHLFPNTPEGHAVLHQLQQRAEAWAEGVSLGFCHVMVISGLTTKIDRES